MNGVGAPTQSKRPPEKGSFPLDHYGECKPFMKVCLVSCGVLYGSSHCTNERLVRG